MTTIKNVTLTTTQFLVSRALARSFGHTWGDCPDHLRTTDDIDCWSRSEDTSIPGITSPDVQVSPHFPHDYDVVHTTATGRLSWQVNTLGNVTIEVHRPDPEGKTAGVCVARATITHNSSDVVGIDEIVLFTSDGNFAEHWTNDDPHPYDVWMSWDPQHLRDDLLCVRHVHALSDAMEAVIQIGFQDCLEDGDTFPVQDCDKHTRSDLQRVVQCILEPLAAIALPDPCNPERPERPEIFWSRSVHPMVEAPFAVHAGGDTFPVETEMTAIHAVMLLQRDPSLSLVEAIKQSIHAKTYRPRSENATTPAAFRDSRNAAGVLLYAWSRPLRYATPPEALRRSWYQACPDIPVWLRCGGRNSPSLLLFVGALPSMLICP